MTDLTEERASIHDQLTELAVGVEKQRADIPALVLQQYDTLRKQMRGIAVSKLNRDAECSVCGVGLTTAMRQQAQRGEVITCPTCGRLVFYP